MVCAWLPKRKNLLATVQRLKMRRKAGGPASGTFLQGKPKERARRDTGETAGPKDCYQGCSQHNRSPGSLQDNQEKPQGCSPRVLFSFMAPFTGNSEMHLLLNPKIRRKGSVPVGCRPSRTEDEGDSGNKISLLICHLGELSFLSILSLTGSQGRPDYTGLVSCTGQLPRSFNIDVLFEEFWLLNASTTQDD